MNAIKNALSRDSDRNDHQDKTTPIKGTTSGRRGSVSSSSSDEGVTTGSRRTGTGKRASGQLPVQPGVTGRAEETRGGSRAVGGPHTGDFTDAHTHGHNRDDATSNDFDPRGATTTHAHTHLAAKTAETRQQHEVEEVERLKDHERHVTHVQHHVQPVHDTEHVAEVHHQRAIPQTHIEERHISSDQDKKAFAGLGAGIKDTVQHANKERTVVDLGERVNETVHHHVHNVIQPVIHKDTHEHHRIHTTIPTHHVTHEAPIVHQSVSHQPLSKDAFLSQGGSLTSGTSHHTADVLATGDCERKVDGIGERLAKDLGLRSGTVADQHEGDTRI